MTRENTETSRMTTPGADVKEEVQRRGYTNLDSEIGFSQCWLNKAYTKKTTTTTINSLKKNIYTSNQYIFKSWLIA